MLTKPAIVVILIMVGIIGTFGLNFSIYTATMTTIEFHEGAAEFGVLSSVIPYLLEMSALRTLPGRVFGILMSLEPAAAALAALVIIGEGLSPTDLVAMACVIAASIGATRSAG